MDTKVLIQAQDRINQELDLETSGSEITEDELLLAISARVAHLMDHDSGLLFSYLYRLDISEYQLAIVIDTPSDDSIAYRIAILILERQKQRIGTKRKFDQGPPIEGWEW